MLQNLVSVMIGTVLAFLIMILTGNEVTTALQACVLGMPISFCLLSYVDWITE